MFGIIWSFLGKFWQKSDHFNKSRNISIFINKILHFYYTFEKSLKLCIRINKREKKLISINDDTLRQKPTIFNF